MLRVLVALALLGLAPRADAQDLRLFTVGSGEVGGGYFDAANAICASVNRANRGLLRCSPEATPGSLYNLVSLRNRQLDFALTQSDWQKAAYEGIGFFAASGPMPNLRSVMSLYPEAITILARSGSGITTLDDIIGKRIDIGPPASGRRASIMRLLTQMGLDRTSFAALLELPTDSNFGELCAGRVDVAILILGHPNASVADVMQRCGATLVPARGPKLDALLRDSRDFVPYLIDSSAYPTLAADVPSYAVTATIVTRDDMDPAVVEALVAATLGDLPQLAIRAPVLAGLEPLEMRSRGLTVPLHPGALAAFSAPPAKP